jgi:hypothetical protein
MTLIETSSTHREQDRANADMPQTSTAAYHHLVRVVAGKPREDRVGRRRPVNVRGEGVGRRAVRVVLVRHPMHVEFYLAQTLRPG